MTGPDWRQALRDDLEHLRAGHLYRARRVTTPIDATHVQIDGRRYVNFASNDYLGLTRHPRVIESMAQALRLFGAGSGAAPLISGYTPAHAAAEAALARWKGTDSAILLPSGFQANAAAVQALASLGGFGGFDEAAAPVRFLLDKLCHASLVDAVQSSGKPFRVFPHNGLAKLSRLLEGSDAGELQVVVTESIFSMDGDAADLRGLAELKRRHGFVLLLDEAHASGVYGPNGSGYAAECGLQDMVDVTVVTLSKALGCSGGAVCASGEFCDALVNFGRPYLFSTAAPPMIAAAAAAALDVLRDEPDRQQRLRERSRAVRAELRSAGFHLPTGDSPIVPLVLGSEQAALDAAARVQAQGLLVLAVRPPAVPRGTSRLRVTISSEHTESELQDLGRAVRDLARA